MAGATVALLVAIGAVVAITGRTSNAPPGTIRVPGHPTGLAVADGRVWVASPRAGTVAEIDAATGRNVTDPLRVVGAPARLAVGAVGVWVADSADGTVIPVRRRPPLAFPAIPLGADVSDVALAGRTVWTISSPESVVRTLEPDGRVRSLPVGRTPVDIDADVGRVVVASAGDGTLTWFDARTQRRLHAPRRVALAPVAVALSGDAAWVADARRGTVTRVDARTGRPSRSALVICPRPIGVAAAGTDVYVLCARDRTVVKVDGKSLDVVWRKAAGDEPTAVAVDERRVWVADAGRDAVISYDR